MFCEATSFKQDINSWDVLEMLSPCIGCHIVQPRATCLCGIRAGSSPRSTSFVVQQPLKQDLSSRAEWDLTQAEKVHYNEDDSESEEDDDSTGYA